MLHDQLLDGGEDLTVPVLGGDDDSNLVLGLCLEPVLAQEAEELVAIGDAGGFDLDGHWIQYLTSRRLS